MFNIKKFLTENNITELSKPRLDEARRSELIKQWANEALHQIKRSQGYKTEGEWIGPRLHKIEDSIQKIHKAV